MPNSHPLPAPPLSSAAARPSSRRRAGLIAWLLPAALLLLASQAAQAALHYALTTAQATAGETIHIQGVLTNEGPDTLAWSAPGQLVLQWRHADGRSIRSLAELEQPERRLSLPVGSYARLSWRAVVPNGVEGLMALNIEGEPALMALDTSPREHSPVAGSPAVGPIVAAGAAPLAGQSDPPLPDATLRSAGLDPEQGPAPAAAALDGSRSPFERFRNALSPYEPIYFIGGTRGGNNARYQVSFKYRLFNPDDPRRARWYDHLYLGYTQTALWDLESRSRPFVDTSYKPSLFWQQDALWEADSGRYFLGLTTGVEHESNGKSGADSRSLNHAYVQPAFNLRLNDGSTLSFAPRFKAYFATAENPDYADYMGRVDWRLRWAQPEGLVLTGLYRQGRENRNSTQIDAAWPLKRTFLNMNGYLHLQYFRGYGETLLGYNHHTGSQFRIGLSLIP